VRWLIVTIIFVRNDERCTVFIDTVRTGTSPTGRGVALDLDAMRQSHAARGRCGQRQQVRGTVPRDGYGSHTSGSVQPAPSTAAHGSHDRGRARPAVRKT
jgi:hypothetical protein